jgi:hypothetical protein
MRLSRRALALLALSAAVLICCSACGGGSSTPTTQVPATKALAVADRANNRVLIYNYPLSDGQSASVVL